MAKKVKIKVGDIWKQEGYKVVSTNLGGVHGRGLAMQAKQQGKISRSNFSFDTSPKNSDVITLAVKGQAPETARVKGKAFSEQTVGGNVKLLESEVNKLINFARKNPTKKINLPFIGLGFGEGKTEEITPILERASREPNIHLISKDQSTVARYTSSFAPGVRSDSTSKTTASVKPPSSGFSPSKQPKGKYIEIKGPFHIPDPKSTEKIKGEIKRLAKEYPKAQFILREIHPSKTRGESVHSAAFKGLVESKQASRAKVVKLDYNRRRVKQLDSPVQIRDQAIKKLDAFKVVEFTFSGDVASEEYKKWRSVDISLSDEMVWDPLRSKNEHLRGFEGYTKDRDLVKKYVGGTSSATKKIDALIDRISEYGRKKGAKVTSVDAGIQYIRDKSAEFEAKQRLDNPLASTIKMLTPERKTRLNRLQKNYGTPPKITGEVSLISTAEKKIIGQVPIEKENIGRYTINLPKFGTKTVTQKSAPSITTSANAPSPVKTPLKIKNISPASLKLAEKLKARLETNQTTVTKPSEGVTKTRHDRLVGIAQVVQTGIVKVAAPKSVIIEGKKSVFQGFDKNIVGTDKVKGRYLYGKKGDLAPEKKGLVKTGLRVDVTDDTPVGITLREDSARDFDVSSVHSQKGDPDRGLWPEPSSQREAGISSSPGKLTGKVISAPAQQSIEGKVYNPKTTQFPDKQPKTKQEQLTPRQRRHRRFAGLKVDRPVITKELGQFKVTQGGTSSNPSSITTGFAVVKGTAPIVHPFSKVKSALTALDELQPAEFGDKEVFVSPAEDFKKSGVEVELGEDVGGGGQTVEESKGSYLEKQAKGLRDELTEQKYWGTNKKWPKGALPASALANRPWIKKNKKGTEIITPIDDKGRMAISDVIHGDSADYVEEGQLAGTRRASATVPHVKEALTPRFFSGDTASKRRRKPLTTEQKARRERLHAEDLKSDTTKVVLSKDKLGRKTETLITKYSEVKIDPIKHTRKTIPIEEQSRWEAVFRKRRGGLSKQEYAKAQYSSKTEQVIKTTDLIKTEVNLEGNVVPEGKPKEVRQKIYTENQNKLSLIRQRQKPGEDISKEVSSIKTEIRESLKSPKRDRFITEDSQGKKHIIQGDISFSGKESGTMTKSTSKKAKSTTLTASQRIRGAFKPVTKVVLPPLFAIGALALSPIVAKWQLKAKGIDDPTAKEYATETAAVFVGAPTVFSGYGEKPGYIQDLAKYDITALRKSGKTKSDYKPIKGAGGPDTPYANIKTWMLKGKRETPKSDWIGY